jgi:Tfp pilus assembly protein PilZ
VSPRKFSRVNFRIAATIKAGGSSFSSDVDNLSMNGMFVVTAEQLQLGEAVDITIILSESSPEIHISVSGTVSRIADNGIGFTFERLDIDSYTHLKNILSYNIDDADRIIDEIHHAITEKIAAEKC